MHGAVNRQKFQVELEGIALKTAHVKNRTVWNLQIFSQKEFWILRCQYALSFYWYFRLFS